MKKKNSFGFFLQKLFKKFVKPKLKKKKKLKTALILIILLF